MKVMRVLASLFVLVLAGCPSPPLSTGPAPSASVTVTTVNVPPAAITATASWTLGATVTNSGNGAAVASSLLYQISTKSTLDSSAITIGTHPVPALAVGDSYVDTYSSSYVIPAAQSGTYWIYVTTVSNKTASASVGVLYPRILIETYNPTGGAVGTIPWISLFDHNGDTNADPTGGFNEWHNDTTPYTVDGAVAIAESGTNGTWESIDFTGNTAYPNGLPPGVYYVRVRGAQSYQTGGYGIRFLSLNPSYVIPAYPTGYTTFASVNAGDSPYEPDDALQAGVPANPVAATVGSIFNRELSVSSDMDWFKLTLP
jgi:hypothetical protein